MVIPTARVVTVEDVYSVSPSSDPVKRRAMNIQEIVATVFGAISALFLGITLYTMFWYVATPATVIAAFNFSATVTLTTGAIALLALYLRPSTTTPSEEPCPAPPQTRRAQLLSAPPFSSQQRQYVPPQPQRPAAQAPSAPSFSASIGGAENRKALIKKELGIHNENVRKLNLQLQTEIHTLLVQRSMSLTLLAPKNIAVQSLDRIEARLATISAEMDKPGNILPKTDQEVEALKNQIAAVKSQLKENITLAAQEFTILEEKRKNYTEWNQNGRLSQSELERQINDKAAALTKLQTEPVQGYFAAKTAKSGAENLEKELELLRRIKSYNVEEFPQGTLEQIQLQLGIPTIRARISAFSIYEAPLKLYDEKKTLMSDREAIYRTHGTLLRNDYAARVRAIERDYTTAKEAAEARNRSALDAEQCRYSDRLIQLAH